MKKFLSAVLMAIMLTGSATAATYSSVGDSGFSDVTPFDRYYDSIKWMGQEDIIDGFSDEANLGKFGPEQCVRRGEFLKMLFELREVPLTESSVRFSDVKSSNWFYNYVGTAVNRGTAKGIEGTGKFEPIRCVTRAEALKMAIEEFHNEVPDYRKYAWRMADVSDTDWHKDYVDYAVSSNIIPTYHITYGSSGALFDPNGALTRGEVAELLYRLRALEDYSSERYRTGFAPQVANSELFNYQCDDSGSDLRNVDVLGALPSSVDLIFDVDLSSSSQLDNLNDLIDKFVDNPDNLVDITKEAYDDNVPRVLSYDSAVKPVLEGDFEMVVGVDFTAPNATPDIYVVMNTEASEQAEQYLARFFHTTLSGDVLCNAEGDAVYWTEPFGDFYLVKSGEFFALTNTAEARNKALDNAKAGKSNSFDIERGFVRFWADVSSVLNATSPDDLAYLDRDLNGLFGVAVSDLDEVSMGLSAESSGLNYNSFVGFTTSDHSLLTAFNNTELKLASKVPSGGDVAIYFEDPTMAPALNTLLLEQLDLDDMFVESFGLTTQELETLIDTPTALVVSNSGDILPKTALYFEVDSDNRDEANKLLEKVDGYVDELITDLNVEASEEGATDDTLYRTTLNAGELRRVHLKDTFPEDFWRNVELDVDNNRIREIMDIEFYYGLTEDDILVFAMYEDFASEYGSNVVLNDAGVSRAKSMVNNGPRLQYLDILELLNSFDFYLNKFIGSDRELLDQVRSALDPIDAFVSSGWKDNNKIKEEAWLIIK